jgi:hypothetical protein
MTTYNFNRDSEKFLLDSYTGKGGYLPASYNNSVNANGSYLLRHPRETDTKYANRCQAAVYPNYIKKIINAVIGFLWKNEPIRDADDDLYQSFLKNANGGGKSLNYLLTSYQRLALIIGTVYIIVDKPNVLATSRADERLPYITMRKPSQVIEDEHDEYGQLTYICFSEENEEDKIVYRHFYTDSWKLTNDEAGNDIIASGQYKLGRVPVVKLHATPPLFECEEQSDSWAFDLAQINWELFNVRSELRELERGQTFSILKLPISNEQERQSLRESGVTISTENALLYDPNGGGDVGYIAPPAEPAQHYIGRIADLIVEIYKLANLEFVGGVQQSSESRQFNFQATNSTLAIMADMCEQAEREIANLVMLWMGKTEFTGNIAYPREFNFVDVKQTIDTAIDAVSLDISPTFDKAIKKQVAHKLLSTDVSATVMQAIDDEIDADGDIYNDRIKTAAGVE